jgi:hypothetical protein
VTDKPLVEKMVEASWWPFRAADGVKRRAEMGAALAVAKPEIEKALLQELSDQHGVKWAARHLGKVAKERGIKLEKEKNNGN